MLAAVNFVESGFGKLRNDSVAGAQGPMQFMPATWRAYGLGGNVHDAHDAIVGAANYLRANGAPARMRNALYHYNPSPLYVDAVLRYAAPDRARPPRVPRVLQLARLRADDGRHEAGDRPGPVSRHTPRPRRQAARAPRRGPLWSRPCA